MSPSPTNFMKPYPSSLHDGINSTTVNGSDNNKTGFTRKETKETWF